VRPAHTSDLEAVVRLWDEMRAGASRWGPQAPPTTLDALRNRLAVLADSAEHEVVVAEIDGEPVGVAVLSVVPLNVLTDERSVQISFMHVRDDSRRKGVGRALVDAAAQRAQEEHTDFVSVAVFPQARESNRFFARLGFSPYSWRRAIPTPALQRKLAGEPMGRRLLTRRRST
jgi:predicted N-acetyltransferase YhbS